jgi:hypothetical protein
MFDFFLDVGLVAGLVDCVMRVFYNKSRHFVKGVGDHSRFTVSLMPFFRGVISKACIFCKLLQDISKKGVAPTVFNLLLRRKWQKP